MANKHSRGRHKSRRERMVRAIRKSKQSHEERSPDCHVMIDRCPDCGDELVDLITLKGGPICTDCGGHIVMETDENRLRQVQPHVDMMRQVPDNARASFTIFRCLECGHHAIRSKCCLSCDFDPFDVDDPTIIRENTVNYDTQTYKFHAHMVLPSPAASGDS